MKNEKKILKKDKVDFTLEYKNVFKNNIKLLDFKTEWKNKGDYFTKFTMYNTNYRTLPSLDSIGSTTLINKL